MLTKERIEEIRERGEAATPGPWEADAPLALPTADGNGTTDCVVLFHKYPDDLLVDDGCPLVGDLAYILTGHENDRCFNVRAGNAAFIAHARQDIPDLLAALDEANRQVVYEQERNANNVLAADWEVVELRAKLAAAEAENKRFKAALAYIVHLESKTHLGRPRKTDTRCVFCLAYSALNNGAWGEYVTTDEYKWWLKCAESALAERKGGSDGR